jgi:cardiolipin synthase A/B
MVSAWTVLLGANYLLAVVAIVTVLLRRKEPTAMVAWILGILALPGVGMLAYWLFASERLRRKVGRRRRRVAHLLHQLKGRVEQHARTAGEWTDAPLPADLASIAELGRRLDLPARQF